MTTTTPIKCAHLGATLDGELVAGGHSWTALTNAERARVWDEVLGQLAANGWLVQRHPRPRILGRRRRTPAEAA